MPLAVCAVRLLSDACHVPQNKTTSECFIALYNDPIKDWGGREHGAGTDDGSYQAGNHAHRNYRKVETLGRGAGGDWRHAAGHGDASAAAAECGTSGGTHRCEAARWRVCLPGGDVCGVHPAGLLRSVRLFRGDGRLCVQLWAWHADGLLADAGLRAFVAVRLPVGRAGEPMGDCRRHVLGAVYTGGCRRCGFSG